MGTTKAQQKAVHKYVKEKYDRLELTIPKGKKQKIKDYAAAAGESVNAYVGKAVDERMARESES